MKEKKEFLKKYLLFYRNALCKISRLIDIAAPGYGKVVSQQLQRDDCKNRGK